MKDITQLSRAALEGTIGRIVDRLFLDLNPLDCPAELRNREVYNPDKTWGIDDWEFIGTVLRTAGLAPDRLGDQPLQPDPTHPPLAERQCQRPAPSRLERQRRGRVRLTLDLRLSLQLTRRQALRASSDEFRTRLRNALEHSTAKDALTQALDLDVESLALREE